MEKHQNNTTHKLSSDAHACPFDIKTIDWLKLNRGYENESQQNDDLFQILWVTKGSGTLLVDLQKFIFERSQVFFIKKGQVYQFQSTVELDGYVISFSHSFLHGEPHEDESIYHSSLFGMFATAGGLEITKALTTDMTEITERMIKEFNNLHSFRNELLRRYLKIFLIYLSRQIEGIIEPPKQTRNIELTQKFTALLDKYFKTEKMVSWYACRLSVTPNYLNEIVKKTTGCSAGYHIRQRIVLEAKRQAVYSGSCMKEIAYSLGFYDMAHFSKFFKNVTGINFTDFKKESIFLSLTSSVAV